MGRSATEEGPHPVDRHVGRKVCEKRLSLGYNQSDLGRALGLTFQQIQKYEKGSNRISSSKLWEIAQFFNVDIGYFFTDLSEGQPPAAGVGTEGQGRDFPATRHSVEITHMAPRLSTRQQKLALEIIRTMAGKATPDRD